MKAINKGIVFFKLKVMQLQSKGVTLLLSDAKRNSLFLYMYLENNAFPTFGINEMHLKQNNLLVQAQEIYNIYYA